MQHVKIQTGFQEKTSENYNSTQHSISLEMDIQVNGNTREIEEASQKLFALCRKIIYAQKGVNVDSLLQAPAAPPSGQAATSTAASKSPQEGQQPRPASSKQIRYIFTIARKNGLSDAEIKSLPVRYEKADFSALTSQEASEIIDHLTSQAQRKAA
jgi:hypothetical protein